MDERREIAARIMAGFAACPGVSQQNPGQAATWAVQWADALIAELDRVPPTVWPDGKPDDEPTPY